MSTNDSDASARDEIEHITATMEQLNAQLAELTCMTEAISAENERDSAAARQMVKYDDANTAVATTTAQSSSSSSSSRQQFAALPAEDATDKVLQLQNQLAIVRRRNELLARENGNEQRTLQLHSRQLDETTRRVDELIALTGWSAQRKPVGDDVRSAQRAAIAEMAKLEAAVQHELRGAKGILQRKEHTIVTLNATLRERRERANVLVKLQNDARERARACRELQIALQRMRSDGSSLDRALVRVEENKTPKANSVAALEHDNAFLAHVAAELKQTCRRQDTIVRAQLARQEQLQRRLDAITTSLREMGLSRDLDKTNDVRALVPAADAAAAAAGVEPEDVAQVLPAGERVPVHTYRLLCKNSEQMRTQVARKNMLVLEKESVLQAMDAKLSSYIAAFNATAMQDDGIRANKNVEMSDLIDDLQAKHESYRERIKQLRHENHELREQLARGRQPSPSSAAASSRRREQQQQQRDALSSTPSTCDVPHGRIALHA